MIPLNPKTLATLAALMFIATGCAQVSDTTSSLGNKLGIQNHDGAAAVGGGIVGCLGGGAIAIVSGRSLIGGCVIGGIAGAAVSAFAAYQQDLEHAHAMAAELNAQHAPTTVTEKTVTVTDKNATGQPETKTVSAIDHISVELPKANLAARSPDIESIITKVGKLAANAKSVETIDVYARTKADQTYIAHVLDGAIAGSKATYTLHQGPVARLVVTPIPVAAS